MSHIFSRSSGSLTTAVRGEGCYIHDTEGRAYLDGSGGAAESCFGHSAPDVPSTVHGQLDQRAFAHTGFFTSGPAEALADLLIANVLEAELLHLGPESLMAFVAEPVVGATAEAVPAVEGYFARSRKICDQYCVFLILDEVICGTGRNGYLIASEHNRISPDIVVIAKGLGAGYAPIGAMLCSETFFDAIISGSGSFQHGHAYHGHQLAAAAGQAAALEQGLICYPAGGMHNGKSGDHVLLAPYVMINTGQIEELVDKLEADIDRALWS